MAVATGAMRFVASNFIYLHSSKRMSGLFCIAENRMGFIINDYFILKKQFFQWNEGET